MDFSYPIPPIVRIPVADAAFRPGQVAAVLHGLERMAFVPLVERVDVDQKESALRVRQGGVGLEANGRRKGLVDSPFARLSLLVWRRVPGIAAGRRWLNCRRLIAGAGLHFPPDDPVETRIDVEREDEILA